MHSLRRLLLGGLLALTAPALARDYFVAPGGNDAGPGSQAQPLKSIEAVNKLTLSPGDRVFFMGGVTYSAGVVIGASGAEGKPIVLASYGKGPAVIAPASSGEPALKILNASYISLSNLVFTGLGRDKSTVNGVQLTNDGAVPQGHIVMDRCEVSGFGNCGFDIEAKHKAGWVGVRITNSRFHHNKNIGVHSAADWLQVPRPNKDLYVGYCKAYSNWGRFDNDANIGGIVLMGISGALIEHCELYDNGGDHPYGGGVFGAWVWSCDHIVMQFNESHHNKQNGKSSDGGGFDLDGATSDSIVQYNYSHDNDGAGVLLAQFPAGAKSGAFKDNIVRYNVSVRDAQRGEYGGITVWGGSAQDYIGRCEIYGNSIYVAPATRGGKPCGVEFIDANQRDVSFYNNIIYTTAGLSLIRMPGRGDNGTVLFKGNDYFTEGGTFRMDWDERRISSMSSWIGIGRGKQEQEDGKTLGMNVDPLWRKAGGGGTISDPALFTRLYDYMLQAGSPLRDKGLDLNKRAGLIAPPGKRDYFGYPVPAGAGWDIGAHEFPVKN